MVTPREIHDRLKAQFPDDVGDFVEEPVEFFSEVKPAAVGRVCAFLKEDPELSFNYLVSISSVDLTANLAAVYHLESMDLESGRTRHAFVMRAQAPRDNPVIASVATVWGTAIWQEREVYDLMGITFEGHPDLKRILTDDDWVGHPLRKDYVFPKTYRGIDLE
ncbi:MAG: NADH-quinone oxidoreductase subunit C [Candidatus Riflebacteria bacterium]|nr:NADH-quinone oxidoreductase subunit C [Candidatus Riflebacteria bacterium]